MAPALMEQPCGLRVVPDKQHYAAAAHYAQQNMRRMPSQAAAAATCGTDVLWDCALTIILHPTLAVFVK